MECHVVDSGMKFDSIIKINEPDTTDMTFLSCCKDCFGDAFVIPLVADAAPG